MVLLIVSLSILSFSNSRAQENASVLGGVSIEMKLLWEELKSRFVAQKERAQIQTSVPPTIVPAGPATTV